MDPAVICYICWPLNYEEEYAVLTARGFWMEHTFKLCDSRKMYNCETNHLKGGHCVCDGYEELEELGTDTTTCSYDGLEHQLEEFNVVKQNENWLLELTEFVKSNQVLPPKFELLWTMIMYIGNIPRKQFQLPANPFKDVIIYTGKMELAANVKEWSEVKKLLIKSWESCEDFLKPKMVAVARRLLLEYICGRSYYRVTNENENHIAPLHIKDREDPIIKQMIGGAWIIFGYITTEVYINKRPLSMKHSGWVDVVSAVLNNWASLHRDFSDGTWNNSIYYYKDSQYSISEDFFAVLNQSIFQSGSSVRSILTLIDLNDQTSRYQFTENYWHCVAAGYESINNEPDICSRLISFYNEFECKTNLEYDVFCYCLQRSIPDPDKNYVEISMVAYSDLYRALNDCHPNKEVNKVYSTLVDSIQEVLKLQGESYEASQKKDNARIKELGLQYRKLRIRQWSLELNDILPIGGNLIIVYHVVKFLLDHKFNVDSGYQNLYEKKFMLD